MTFNIRWIVKALVFGLINFAARFAVGGVLWYGVKLNPEGFAYGAILTVAAFVFAFLCMRFLMKPQTLKEAITTGIIWASIGLVLDVVLLGAVFQAVAIPYLLRELQTWTRTAAVVAAGFISVKRR